MGWLTKMLSPEDPSAPLYPTSWMGEGMSGNDSGIQITELKSRSASGVLACTRVISEAAAAYPKEIYQKLPQGKRIAYEHSLWPMIHDCPNPHMTNVVFWVGIISQTCLWGNGYAEIQRDGANRPRAMWPLPADKTRAVRENGVLVYKTTATPSGMERTIQPENIIHIPFLSFDGLQGYSPVQLRRQGLGLNMAAERFGSMLFGKGSRPSGILTPAVELKPEAKQQLKDSWQQGTSGANALGVALMPMGVTFSPLTINPTDAQFLETRKYQLEEVARDYRVPGHMVGILELATHSNSEQLGLDFSTYTMLHWVQLIEQELQRKLFANTQFYIKLNMDVFLRGDFATRMAGYSEMRNVGVLSADNINDFEGWERIGPDAGGDVRIVPMNFVSLKQMKAHEDDPAPEPGATGMEGGVDDSEPTKQLQQRLAVSFKRLFQDATGRTVNREKRDAAFVHKTWTPTLLALAESLAALKGQPELKPEMHTFLDDYTGALALRCADWKHENAGQTASAEFARAYTAISGKV